MLLAVGVIAEIDVREIIMSAASLRVEKAPVAHIRTSRTRGWRTRVRFDQRLDRQAVFSKIRLLNRPDVLVVITLIPYAYERESSTKNTDGVDLRVDLELCGPGLRHALARAVESVVTQSHTARTRPLRKRRRAGSQQFPLRVRIQPRNHPISSLKKPLQVEVLWGQDVGIYAHSQMELL